MGAYYLLKQTAPGIDPLGPENLLIFANSVIAGYPAAGLVRYIVCAKSPLTNGMGETRSEGPFAVALKKSGYDAIILHGAADNPTGLMIDNGGDYILRCGGCVGQECRGNHRCAGRAVWQGYRCRRHRPRRRKPGALCQHRQRPHPPGPAHGHGRGDGVKKPQGDCAARRRAAAGARPCRIRTDQRKIRSRHPAQHPLKLAEEPARLCGLGPRPRDRRRPGH